MGTAAWLGSVHEYQRSEAPMTTSIYGEYGPGRDFSNDPPIIWDGSFNIPPGWTCRLVLGKVRKGGSKRLKQPESDRNVTEEWLASQKASAEAIRLARQLSKDIREGRIPPPPPHDFSGVTTRITLQVEEPVTPAAEKRPWGQPGSWRDE